MIIVWLAPFKLNAALVEFFYDCHIKEGGIPLSVENMQKIISFIIMYDCADRCEANSHMSAWACLLSLQ